MRLSESIHCQERNGGRMMRVGTIAYATEQGIGYLPLWFYRAGVITDAMVFRHGSRPTRMEWYRPGTRELVGRPFTGLDVESFVLSCDVMLFFETPFDWQVLDLCRRLGVKTVIVPMYECTPERPPAVPDAWFCPSLLDQRDYFKNSPFVPIPVPPDVEWVERTEARRWLHNAGNLGLRGHKGTLEILQAVRHVKNPDFRLTVRAQDVTALRAVLSRVPGVETDPRVQVFYGDVHRAHLFEYHDVFIMAEKYNGLSLPLMEARAAGMLVVTSDRFPTNTWLPAEPLIPVRDYSRQRVGGSFNGYDEARVTPEAIAETIDRLMGTDVAQYSRDGAEWARKNSWEELKPVWKEELRKVVEA